MNKVILMGRLTKDPEFRYVNNASSTPLAIYTLAVPREYIRDGEQEADFIRCVVFGRLAEFAEKYLYKGIKMLITGRLQTGSYIKQETNEKVYTTTVIVEKQEFAESKAVSQEYLERNNQRGASGSGSKPSDVEEDSYYGDMISKAFGYDRGKSNYPMPDFKAPSQSPKPYKSTAEEEDIYAGYSSSNPWGDSSEEELEDELPF